VCLPVLSLLFVLASSTAGPATEFVGQLVCSQCWFEADRNRTPYGTTSDLACAARCAEEGVPPALAVRNETGFDLLLVEGDQDWSDLIGRFARVRGTTEDREGKRILQVSSVEALEDSPWPVVPDDPEPAELVWTDPGGHSQAIEAYRGRVVVLNFWATWCAPCRKEMPDLVRIQNRYGILGVQVLGAAADSPEAAPSVVEFARKYRINFPVLLGATTSQMHSLGLGVALPATVVIDRHGHVVERISGVFDHAKLEELLDRLLDNEPVKVATADPPDPSDPAAKRAGHDHRPHGGTMASLVPS